MRHIWVVEMKCMGKWKPTVGCKLTRKEGREELKSWRRRNKSDDFRLRKYAPEVKP